MRITSKGQVTIPIALRERAGFLPGVEVEFELEPDGLAIRKARGSATRGERLAQSMLGKGDIKLTTDEILALMRGEDE